MSGSPSAVKETREGDCFIVHTRNCDLWRQEVGQWVGQGMEWEWGVCIIVYTMQSPIFMRLYFCKLYE